MPLTLYGHPFAAFYQKVVVALYENGIPFELRLLGEGHVPRQAFAGDEAALPAPSTAPPGVSMPMVFDGGVSR
jgi:hypothetical protein